MPITDVNKFTSLVLKNLYASQNSTGNLALGGMTLYVLMGIINLGLKRRSHVQLSQFLSNGDEEIFSKDWKYSKYGTKWSNLLKLSERLSIVRLGLFYSCYLYDNFEKILKTFHFHQEKFEYFNSTSSIQKMRQWMYFPNDVSISTNSGEFIWTDNLISVLSRISHRVIWKTNFESGLTKPELFFDDKGNQFMVPMMNEESKYLIYDSLVHNYRIHFKFIDEQEFYTVIVLPKEGHRIADVLKNFQFDHLDTYFRYAKFVPAHLKLPKFKIFSQNNLIETFKHHGVTDIFHPDLSDFGMMTNDTVYIGNLMQAANIVVNDDGGRSSGTRDTKVDSQTQKVFHVTRPFLFLVYGWISNVVLISAVVTNPKVD
ncbi:Serpin I2 [Thelohanellus kitauei]|uniref:Serpin I2 n=1 Tax=Thelohanellus kitauei TaxID=669202 RepID=A0A0C2MND6_THEKT|nr:Serpin I2 [Thelohanellus kitauei]